MVDIEINQADLEYLNRILVKLDDMTPVQIAIKQAIMHLAGKAREYPAATEANQAGPYPKRWYERGYGSRWALVGGGSGGRKTSKTLGRKWTSKVSADGLTGTVGNNVSYGPYVMDADKQAACHKEHGWNTVQKIIVEEEPTIVKLFLDAINKVMSGG